MPNIARPAQSSDLYYPDLGGEKPDRQWMDSVRDAIRLLYDSIYQLGGRKGQHIFLNDTVEVKGDISISEVGGRLRIAETGWLNIAGKTRSDACLGIVKLDRGAATVYATKTRADSRIFLTGQDNSVQGILRVSARLENTSFTITSSRNADSGIVAWLMVQPYQSKDQN